MIRETLFRSPSPRIATCRRNGVSLLVTKLQLGNAIVFEAPLRQRALGLARVPVLQMRPVAKQSFEDKRVPKLELRHEGGGMRK